MLDLLKFHGVIVAPVSSSNPKGQQQGECPFPDCGENKFFVNPERQLWDCKKCHREGNQYTFLTQLHEVSLPGTTRSEYEQLASKRTGIDPETLRLARFAYDGYRWLVPYQNGSDYLNNLGAFRSKYGFRILKSPGLPLKLYRPFDCKSLKDTVVIVEGEWDLLAIKPYLPKDYSVVAVPGAMSFKQEFIPEFRNKDVILLYDRDEGGTAGISKAIKLLNPVANSIKFLSWPDDLAFPSADNKDEAGTDLRDLVAHFDGEGNNG